MAWQRRGNKYPNGKKQGKNYEKKPALTEAEQSPKEVSPGHITSIESQKKNSNRISIFLDGKFAFGLHQDTLLQNSLHSGLFLEEPYILELLAADALLRAKEASIMYLGHRARSEHEVRQKLKGKGFDEDVVAQVIKRLYELSYLDDARFAQNYTRSRFNGKGYGPKRIRAELRRLGIKSSLIEQTLEELLNKEDLVDRAFLEAEKRLKRLRNETDLTKKRRKLYDFLIRRGHTSDIAQEVIARLDLHTQF